MEGEGEEQHERAERGMSLKVHMNVMAAALWVRTCAVAVAISPFWYESGSLVMSCPHLLTVQNNPLQNEDCKEASSHDKLWKRETGLFETSIERLFQLKDYYYYYYSI